MIASLIGLSACSSTVAPISLPLDGSLVGDGAASDLGGDATADARMPDASVQDAPRRDVAVAVDGRAPDAPRGPSLTGQWRITRWEYTDGDGRETTLTDVNAPVDVGMGMTAPFRVNGAMTLTPTRLDFSFGTLGSDHFYVYSMASASGANYSATGFSLLGLWDDRSDTFSLPAAAYTMRFSRVGDNTITLDSSEDGKRSITTLQRAEEPAGATTVNLVGAAQLRDPMRSEAFTHARFSLLWDVPAGATPIETSRSPLTFRSGYAGYTVSFAGSPSAEVIGRVAGVRVAVALPFVYDDVNNNGRFDTGDRSRGLGPLALVWRGDGTPTGEWADGPLAATVPGWQIAHMHRVNGEGDWRVSPFDASRQPSLDVPVSATVLRGEVPRFVR